MTPRLIAFRTFSLTMLVALDKLEGRLPELKIALFYQPGGSRIVLANAGKDATSVGPSSNAEKWPLAG
jgi:hypothetical protein